MCKTLLACCLQRALLPEALSGRNLLLSLWPSQWQKRARDGEWNIGRGECHGPACFSSSSWAGLTSLPWFTYKRVVLHSGLFWNCHYSQFFFVVFLPVFPFHGCVLLVTWFSELHVIEINWDACVKMFMSKKSFEFSMVFLYCAFLQREISLLPSKLIQPQSNQISMGKPKLQMWHTPLQKTFMSMASRFQVCSSSSFPWTHSCTLVNNQIKATWWIVSSEGGGIWFWKKYMSVWELSLERPFLFSICLLLSL